MQSGAPTDRRPRSPLLTRTRSSRRRGCRRRRSPASRTISVCAPARSACSRADATSSVRLARRLGERLLPLLDQPASLLDLVWNRRAHLVEQRNDLAAVEPHLPGQRHRLRVLHLLVEPLDQTSTSTRPSMLVARADVSGFTDSVPTLGEVHRGRLRGQPPPTNAGEATSTEHPPVKQTRSRTAVGYRASPPSPIDRSAQRISF
jgi:hypothetical protein